MHASAHSHWLHLVALPQFNARSESVAEKPAFRRLVPSRRCLVRVGVATSCHSTSGSNAGVHPCACVWVPLPGKVTAELESVCKGCLQ